MVHVLSTLKNNVPSVPTARTPRSIRSGSGTSAATSTGGSSAGAAADFRSLFSPKASAASSTVTASTSAADSPSTLAASAAPTAESVFGPNPWITNPTGIGPDGNSYNYNPYYFATQQTAEKVAQMVGGTVVQTNFFTGTGGPYAQQQPNYMVQLADGRVINPGLVASFYTHGYPQSYIDMMVACEVKNS